MESDSRSGGPGKGALEELMRERIRVTIESIVDEELEAALGGVASGVTPLRWTVRGCGNQCFDGGCSRSQWVIDSRGRNGGDEGYTILR